MNIVIFDTETTSLEKPFCYNIGYIIANVENKEILVKRDFVCEQVWHNPMLFTTAYYADKRPIYIDRMRKHTTIMNKFGYICQQMIRDFKAYEVQGGYAYNSSFDEKVFNFNCDWFKCNNPFDNVPIFDIRGYAHYTLVHQDYMDFCEEYGYFTESGNYSTTAETMYRFLFDNNFTEEHTALADSEIEYEILLECFCEGAKINFDYKAKRSIERKQEKELHIRTAEQTDYYFSYKKIRINKDKTEITLK